MEEENTYTSKLEQQQEFILSRKKYNSEEYFNKVKETFGIESSSSEGISIFQKRISNSEINVTEEIKQLAQNDAKELFKLSKQVQKDARK